MITQMAEQGERLENIENKIDDIDENIVFSRKLMVEISKAAIKDKLIQLLCAIMTICIVVIIIFTQMG